MAVLSYNEIVPRKIIEYNGEPCEVLASHVFRKQQRKPVNQTKLRGLKSGKVLEISFHQSETVKEADTEKRDLTYIYTARGESWFHETGNPKERFALPEQQVAEQIKWIKEKDDVEALAQHPVVQRHDLLLLQFSQLIDRVIALLQQRFLALQCLL